MLLPLVTGLLLIFAALAYRLVDLQILRHDELEAKARSYTKRTLVRAPRRGNIVDARGNLLAVSVFVKTVCADPVLVGNRQTEVARALAPLLNLPEGELAARLQVRARTNETGLLVTNRYVVLKRKVNPDVWQAVQDRMANLNFGVNEDALSRKERSFFRILRRSAIFTDPVDDQLRVYPHRALAAHVLGFVGTKEPTEAGALGFETNGKDGLELVLDDRLSGSTGMRRTENDRGRREVVAFRDADVAPQPGLNVVLTLDAGVQSIVEQELAAAMDKHTPISASALVLRPRTGEILALANLPNFDPNRPGDVREEARRNRLITDIAEPGSTYKVIVISSALNEGLVSLADQFDCEQGAFHYAGRTLHDLHRYGVLSVEYIIAKSSNIGAAKVGIKLGEERLYQYMRDYGFGTRSGIPLPGEVAGIVHPLNKWSKLSISRIPMGHEVAVTPLQMAMAVSAVANHGRLMRPMLIDRLEDAEGRVVARYAPQLVRQVISPEAAQNMVHALKTVVSTNGTAAKARLPGFCVAGKTGTADKVAPGGGYLRGKCFSSFIGFFPADDPELCIAVVLDEPKDVHVGGETAAPCFHNIALRAANYLNLRPELPLAPPAADTRLASRAAAASMRVATPPSTD